MFHVYALKSLERNYIYVGLTENIEERFHRHNSGRECTTASYRPFRLLYTETIETRIEARCREKQLKSSVGKIFLKSL
jgi:putative endonuclease